MGLELWIVDLVMSCFFLGCIVKDVGNCGRVDVGGNLPLITTGFLTKERGFGLLLVYGWDKGSLFQKDSHQPSACVDSSFYWDVLLCITTSASPVCQMFEYSRTNHGFDSTNIWRCTVWQIHDSTSNIRIFGFDRVKMSFTVLIIVENGTNSVNGWGNLDLE